METLLEVVKSNKKINHIFQNCPYKILSHMELVHVKAKKFSLIQGNCYDSVYIIVSGKLKIFVAEENGRQILLDIYKEGNFIGEQEAYLNAPYSASIESITDCLMIKIPNTYFLEWVRLDSHFNELLLQSLCEQMYELTNRAAKYSLATVKEQVIATIFDLYESHQIIEKKLLVESVSATPRSVYRVLNELEQLSLIQVEPKIISILDEVKLLNEGKKI